MNASLNALAGHVAAPAPQHWIAHQVISESGQPASFNEHLSEQVKRSRFKAPLKSKAGPFAPAVRKSSPESARERLGAAGKNRASAKALKNPAHGPEIKTARKDDPGESSMSSTMGCAPAPETAARLLSPSEVSGEGHQDDSQTSEKARQAMEATAAAQSLFSLRPATAPIAIGRPAQDASAIIEEVKAVTADSSEETAGPLNELEKPAISQNPDPNELSETSGAESPDQNRFTDSIEVGQPEQHLSPIGSGDSSDLPCVPTNDVAPQPDGTDAAKQSLPMKNAVEMDEFAGSAVKNLPSADDALEIPAVRIISHEHQRRDQNEASFSNISITSTANSSAMASKNHVESISDVPLVERVARTVLEGVAQIRHTGTDSVSVVLKPDSGTELLLRVEMRDGALSAHLHFERGDRALLDQHWNELQRRLAEQGVRLNYGEPSSSEFAQSQHRPALPDHDSPSAGLPMSDTKRVSDHETNPPRTASGFERWA